MLDSWTCPGLFVYLEVELNGLCLQNPQILRIFDDVTLGNLKNSMAMNF